MNYYPNISLSFSWGHGGWHQEKSRVGLGNKYLGQTRRLQKVDPYAITYMTNSSLFS